MISYIKGILTEKDQEGVVIETNGVGFFIRTPDINNPKLPVCGKEVKLYTYLHVKEDLLQLYGFLKREDLQMFELMLRVNGIGPKGAITVLSGISADDLRFAILAGDAKTIAKKAPGVGVKTAQKMILELKDKLHLEDALELALDTDIQQQTSAFNNAKSEAVLALTALGYNNAQALHAVSVIEGAENMKVEDLLKAALKHI